MMAYSEAKGGNSLIGLGICRHTFFIDSVFRGFPPRSTFIQSLSFFSFHGNKVFGSSSSAKLLLYHLAATAAEILTCACVHASFYTHIQDLVDIIPPIFSTSSEESTSALAGRQIIMWKQRMPQLPYVLLVCNCLYMLYNKLLYINYYTNFSPKKTLMREMDKNDHLVQ